MKSESYQAYIFYFDIVGVVKEFLRDQKVLKRLLIFQRSVRKATLGLGSPWSTLVTFGDNVWARINNLEPAAEFSILRLAAITMKKAQKCKFKDYFGVCTFGTHVFNPMDKIRSEKEDPTDITTQHIDSTSEPHIRAALAEKWSKELARKDLVPKNCVWVSEEVADYDTLSSFTQVDKLFCIVGETFDLTTYSTSTGQRWPFSAKSRFTAIRPK